MLFYAFREFVVGSVKSVEICLQWHWRHWKWKKRSSSDVRLCDIVIVAVPLSKSSNRRSGNGIVLLIFFHSAVVVCHPSCAFSNANDCDKLRHAPSVNIKWINVRECEQYAVGHLNEWEWDNRPKNFHCGISYFIWIFNFILDSIQHRRQFYQLRTLSDSKRRVTSLLILLLQAYRAQNIWMFVNNSHSSKV